MSRYIITINALLILSMFVSDISAQGASMAKMAEGSEQLGSHHVTIVTTATDGIHFVSKNMAGSPQYADFVFNTIRVIIKNEQLLINGKDYGKLEFGDSVRVEFGDILVQSTKREGVLLTSESQKKLFPVTCSCEINEEIYGYPITIKLKTLSCIYRKFDDRIKFLKNNLTADETTLFIRNNDNTLLINSEAYGYLRKGDKIEFVDGEVFVSGKLRQKGDMGNIPTLEILGKEIEKLVKTNIPKAVFIQEKNVIRFEFLKSESEMSESSTKERDKFFVRGLLSVRPGRFPGDSGESVVRRFEEPNHRYIFLNPYSSDFKCYLSVTLHSQMELSTEFENAFIKLTQNFESYLEK